LGCVQFWLDDGLVAGFGSGSPIKSLSLVLSAWICPAAAVLRTVTKLEVRPHRLLIRLGGNFNASDGGDSGDHVCSSANHEPDGDHRNAYTLQHGGLIEHASGVRMPKKQEE
jgi:hypothetical protein